MMDQFVIECDKNKAQVIDVKSKCFEDEEVLITSWSDRKYTSCGVWIAQLGKLYGESIDESVRNMLKW